MRRLVVGVLSVSIGVALVPGCGNDNVGCDAVVRTWLDRMDAEEDGRRAAEEAFALLGPAARANLAERAARAGRMQGERYEPVQMLAEGRFGLKFPPKRFVAHPATAPAGGAPAGVTGGVVDAVTTVDVVGADPATEHATVRCVREGKTWKVEPDLPPPAPAVRVDHDAG